MPSKRRPTLPPTPTWTCPHCGNVHTPATLMRLDNENLKCATCGEKFSIVGGQRLVLVELTAWTECSGNDVRMRAWRSSAGCLTRKYVAVHKGEDVGYVALDWLPPEYVVGLLLYEMWVLPSARHRGIGGRILVAVEERARISGYQKVSLVARSLEEYPQAALIDWYRSHGYTRTVCNQDGMEEIF
jgi:GNAT superfamily N-acetyltransferase